MTFGLWALDFGLIGAQKSHKSRMTLRPEEVMALGLGAYEYWG